MFIIAVLKPYVIILHPTVIIIDNYVFFKFIQIKIYIGRSIIKLSYSIQLTFCIIVHDIIYTHNITDFIIYINECNIHMNSQTYSTCVIILCCYQCKCVMTSKQISVVNTK